MKMPDRPKPIGFAAKGAIVAALVAQNVFLVLAVQKLRSGRGSALYCPTVAVSVSEILKLLLWTARGRQSTGSWASVGRFVVDQWTVTQSRRDTMLMALPAILYVVQSNLLYFALGHIDAVTYQLTSQLKILASAGFMVTLLGRQLNGLQWLSLGILAAGIATVQLASAPESRKSADPATEVPAQTFYLLGLLAVATASLTSGFAGVYLERIFKKAAKVVARDMEQNDEKGPLILRSPTKESAESELPDNHMSTMAVQPIMDDLAAANIRLSFFSIPIAVASSLSTPCGGSPLAGWLAIAQWPALAWFAAINSAIGGIVVALTIKHLDNIIKSFATAGSIALAGLLGPQAGPHGLDWWIGTSAVVLSIWMYNIA